MVQDIRTLTVASMMSFHTVARLGGVSAAADHLGIAKSGVSRHIAQLEDHFGIRLLERGGRSVRLTPIGGKLNERIKSLLAEVDMLSEIANEETKGVSGQVTIAATPEFGKLLATELFPQIRERHPDLSLVMRTEYGFEDMQDPGTDLAFRVGTFKDDRLVARNLGGFSRWLVAAPNGGPGLGLHHPRDLLDQPCLTFRGDTPEASWRFVSDLEDVVVDVKGPISVRNFAILMELAIDGHGFAYLPSFILKDALRQGKLVRCLENYASNPMQVYLTFRPGARNIARVSAVIDAAEEIVPTLL